MYNTGNPIGSTAPKDFSDNSEITDRYVNDVVNETTQDRLGRSRLTIHGQQEKARRSFEQFESDADNVIANLGFFPPVDYTTGLTVDSRNFTTTYIGIVYAAQPSAVPFTTGAWDAAQWYPIQNVLNQKNLLVFGTYAEASAAAATLPDGQVVEVVTDETRADARTRYKAQDGVLVFVVNLDQLKLDLADADEARGAAMVGYLPVGSEAVATTVQDKLREMVSVKDFGAVGDGVADDTTALQAARDYIASKAQPKRLVFPAGIYKYSLSPNWAIQDVEIEALGEVRLRYTGTGNAVIIDADAPDAVCFTPGLCYNVKIGYFLVEAPNTAQNGVYIRSIHHGHLGFKVLGAGSASAGIRVEFAVCTVFDRPTVSVNTEAWYLGAKPKYGLHLTRRNASEETSYCTFFTPILEATETGANLEWALGNTFLAGTMEGCTDTGVLVSENSRLNKFFNVDYEFNTVADIVCGGYENEFYACDSDNYSLITAAGRRNKIIGGSYKTLGVASGAQNNLLSDVSYNRFPGGGIVDSGTGTRMSNLLNIQTGKYHNAIPTIKTIAGPASGAEYINTTGNDVTVIPVVSGGSITYYGFNRNGTGNSVGYLSGPTFLSPGDGLTFIYTGTLSLLVATM